MDKLTITFSLDKNLTISCPELNFKEEVTSVEESLKNVQFALDHLVVENYNSVAELSPFLVALYKCSLQGESLDDGFLEVLKKDQLKKRFQEAFFKEYPKAATGLFAHLSIPSIFWDSSQEDLKKQREAYEALVNNGKEDPKWIEFVQWVVVPSIGFYDLSYQIKVWERWKYIGLPIQGLEQIIEQYKSW